MCIAPVEERDFTPENPGDIGAGEDPARWDYAELRSFSGGCQFRPIEFPPLCALMKGSHCKTDRLEAKSIMNTEQRGRKGPLC